MPRGYRHIKGYEKEILELKEQGMTLREIGLDCQVKCNDLFRKISSGVFQPKDLRGLRLRSKATLSASSCVTSAKDVRFGKN